MTRVLLQRVIRPASAGASGLYWRLDRPGFDQPLAEDEALDLDTYFNSIDEATWVRHTRATAFRIELDVSGPAWVQLWRHSRAAPPALIAEARTNGEQPLVITVPDPPHARAAGRLALTIRAGADGVALRGGCVTVEAELRPVRVVPVICTYNRDGPLIALLHRIGTDATAAASLAWLVIVNNGAPGLPARLEAAAIPLPLRSKLRIVEQANLGGAGGFTRGLLEARDGGATHAIMLDDDVEIEPEALLRTARFYAMARHDALIAGHMLDLFRPTHLYEAGARLIDHKLALLPLHHGVELSHAGSLNRFLEPSPMHYNGWWFLGVPIAVLERHGWPLPCFIRGDDVEFGRRMHDAGVPHVAMAGIGIWHEPFYAKLGSWHLYYEFRNMLILASRHDLAPPATMAFTAVKWIVADLLTFRYQRAALLIRAIGDFLDGPAMLNRNPRMVHASLNAVRQAYGPETVSREQVIDHPHPPIGPRTRLAFVISLIAALVSEWSRPTAHRATVRVEPRDHLWFRVRRADIVVVNEGWEIEQPRYTRSREVFRALALQTVALTRRMRRAMPEAVRAWRAGHEVLTTERAWRAYIEMHAGPPAPAEHAGAAEGQAVAAE